MNTTFQTLSKMLVKTFSLAPEQLSPNASLAGLNIDSLGTVELLWQVEEVFGVSLPAKPPELLTLGDVVRFIDALVADGPGPTHAPPMPVWTAKAPEAALTLAAAAAAAPMP